MNELYPPKRTSQEGHTHAVCPRCGAELCAGLILDKGKQYKSADAKGYARAYGWPETRCFSARIGVEVPGGYDGVAYWAYTCCGLVVDRSTNEEAPATVATSAFGGSDD